MKQQAELSTRRPSRAVSQAAAKLAAEPLRLLQVRLPKSVHRKLCIRVAEQGVTIRAFVMELLEREGIAS